MNNFITTESCYGKFIVNQHCHYMDYLIKTGTPHINSDLQQIFSVIDLMVDCVFLDAGANMGLITMPVAKRILPCNGRVIAFEPQRMLCYALAGTIALNDLPNVELHNEGLGDKVTEMYVTAFDYGIRNDYGQGQLTESGPGKKVKVVTIDSLNLNRLDFIKLDVEAMELKVLSGGEATLCKYKPAMWIEYVHCGGKGKVLQHLQGMGLDYEIIGEDYMNIMLRSS